MESLLHVVNLTKRHAGRPVLRGVTFDIAPGEVMGLIGENGVGKSTLMSILSGTYRADSGEVYVDGELFDVHSQSEAISRGIGVIRQDLNVNPRLTVAQAIYRTSKHSGLPHDDVKDMAQAVLDEHDFSLSPDLTLGQLNGPERVMVEVVRMLVENARLVLMDEVGALFNRHEIDDMHYLVHRMTERGSSVIYISHRLSEVKHVSNRVMVIKEGVVHTILDATTTTPDQMANVLLTREQIEVSDRSSHVRDEVALQIRGLSTTALLDDIDLDLHRGEVLGLAGPVRKGGMNELADALSGRSLSTVRGHVTLNGQTHDMEDEPKLGIAYFSDEEQFGFEDSETIAKSLMAGGDSDSEYQSEVDALREIIDIIQSLNIKATGATHELKHLSGGDRQKVALKKWLKNAKDILILNHPTRGLDVRSRQDLHKLLFDHTAEGGSAVLISSDPTELMQWCDRIALMRMGAISRIVTPEETDEDDLSDAMVSAPARALIIEDDEDDYDDESDDNDFQGFAARRFLVG